MLNGKKIAVQNYKVHKHLYSNLNSLAASQLELNDNSYERQPERTTGVRIPIIV